MEGSAWARSSDRHSTAETPGANEKKRLSFVRIPAVKISARKKTDLSGTKVRMAASDGPFETKMG